MVGKNKKSDVDFAVSQQQKIEQEADETNQLLKLQSFMTAINSSIQTISNSVGQSNQINNDNFISIRKEMSDLKSAIETKDINIQGEFLKNFEMVTRISQKFEAAQEDNNRKINDINEKLQWIVKDYYEFQKSHCTLEDMKLLKKVLLGERKKDIFWISSKKAVHNFVRSEGFKKYSSFIIKLCIYSILLIVYGYIAVNFPEIKKWIDEHVLKNAKEVIK